MHPNTYFDQIYIVNLARRKDKLTAVLAGLDQYKIKVHIIEAIDGYHPQIYGVQDDIPAGAYGYLLSWKKTLQNAIQKEYQKILILDDDVVLAKDFITKWKNWIAVPTRKKCKIMLLGATQHVSIPIDSLKTDYYIPKTTDGSFAVGLQGQDVIKAVYNQIQSDKPKYVDSDILRHFYRKWPNSVQVAWPNLAIAQVITSDIRPGRKQEDLAAKVGWNLSLYHFPLQNPLVSIIVPCYNAERTIKRCLESLFDQTYRPLEIIVIDDGSSDKSLAVISQVFQGWEYSEKAKDVRFQIYHHGKNKGCYVSRNHGLDRANGQLIAFQDADDISLKYRIEDQVASLYEHSVAFTTCLILRTHLHYLSDDPIQLSQDIARTRIHQHKYCCRSKVGLVTTMFRREVVQKLGRYLEWKWGADAEYVQRLFKKLDKDTSMMNYLNDNREILGVHYCVPEVLYLSHEMTSSNLTSQRKKLKNISQNNVNQSAN